MALRSLQAVLLLSSGLVLACPSAEGSLYVEITASIDVTWFNVKAVNGKMIDEKAHYTTTCTVGTNRWRIDHDFLPNAKTSDFFDGTNVYQLVQVTKEPALSPEQAKLIAKLGLVVAGSELYSNRFVEISPGGHPLSDLGVNVPWLALCSACYLKQKGQRLPLPLRPIRYTVDSFAYPGNVILFGDDLGLPRSVEWVTSVKEFTRSLDDDRLSRDNRTLQIRSLVLRPSKDGLLRARYNVEESTNVLGWHIPLKFDIVDYGNGFQLGTNPVCRASGQVQSIRETKEPEGVFEWNQYQSVNDHRFRSGKKLIDFIHYPWTNGLVPLRNDPILVEVFNKKVDRAALDPRLSAGRWRIAIVALLLLGPAVFVAMWCWHRRFAK
jgi:hypothetical protein